MKTLSSIALFQCDSRTLSVFARILLVVMLSVHSLIASAQSGEIEEVIIYQEYIPDEKLETASISDLLDADDMSITGDSNVGDALKRLPGLSLVDGKFIYIRGLGERYSSTYFNGTPMPGIEPLSRAVPLDLFDASVISSTLVQKTYSVQYSSEFSGGVVDIRSAAVPDASGFDLSFSTGHNSISTGKEKWTYDGGGRDWLGYDDGTRDIPGIVRSNLDSYPDNLNLAGGLSPELRDEQALSFSQQNNVWEINNSGKNPEDFGVSLALKQRWDDFSRMSAGLIATLSYDQKWRNRYEDRYRWGDAATARSSSDYLHSAFGSEDEVAQVGYQYGDELVTSGSLQGATNVLADAGLSTVGFYQRTQREVALNALVSLGISVDDIHEFKLTKMLLRQTTDEASLTSTRNGNTGRVDEFTRLIFVENEIDLSQISGSHYWNAAEINWRVAQVDGSRDVPDERVVGRGIGSGEIVGQDDPRLGMDTQTANGYQPARSYTFLDDSGDELGIDFKIPFTSAFVQDFELRVGYARYEKKRSYEAFRFRYNLLNFQNYDDLLGLTNDEFNAFRRQDFSVLTDAAGCQAGGINSLNDDCFLHLANSGDSLADKAGAIEIETGFRGTPSEYSGSVFSEATYAAFDLKFSEVFRLKLGIRTERYTIKGSVPGTVDEFNNITSLSQLNPTLVSDGVYPSAEFNWNFFENMALRGSYSETQNRPSLTELIAVRIFNTKDGRLYEGNPDLLIADVTSYDLRYEWYFGDQDYFSLSAYEKIIDNPIETENVTGEGTPFTTWVNHSQAINEGFELELRKYFGEYFSFIANVSRVDSELDENLRDSADNIVATIKNSRPLQGVSKELYNAQAIYQNDVMSASLAWNYYTRRISTILGSNTGIQNIYELPRDTMDFNFKYNFYIDDGELGIGFKVKNILDAKAEERYENGLLYDRYDIGQTYSLSLSWKQ